MSEFTYRKKLVIFRGAPVKKDTLYLYLYDCAKVFSKFNVGDLYVFVIFEHETYIKTLLSLIDA